MSPNLTQYMRDGVLLGRGGSSSGATLRDSLVPGLYVPGIQADSVGLINPSATFTNREADANGVVTLTTANMLYENVNFWGAIKPNAPNIRFRNCRMAGPDPAIVKARDDASSDDAFQIGAITNYGANPYLATLDDCLMDGYLWNTMRGRTVTNEAGATGRPAYGGVYGIHGGNVILRRVDMQNFTDCFNFIGPGANDVGQVDAHQVLIHASRLHKCDWANGSGLSDPNGYHSDAFQTNKGRNVEIRYSLIGGARDATGYSLPLGAGYNSGDDMWNSALMLQQEVSSSYIDWLTNINIHDNWLAGGTATINLAYKNTNTLAGLTLRNNKILRRGTTVASHGIKNDGTIYIIKQDEITAVIDNNTIWDWFGDINGTGVLVPITRG